jgi:hypothetical protein
MRVFIIKASLVTILIILLTGIAGTSLALFGPFSPGNVLFPVQDWCEQVGAQVYAVGASRAGYFLTLVTRRIDDLETRIGTPYELDALIALDQAIDRSTIAIASTPDPAASDMRLNLIDMVRGVEGELSNLLYLPIEHPDILEAFQAKLQILIAMAAGDSSSMSMENIPTITIQATPGAVSSLSIIAGGSLPGGMVPFPPGSPGAVHAFFPLVGSHAALQCTSCHRSGQYQGIPNTCEGCHLTDKPDDHFTGNCAACHNPNSWQEVTFDHQVAGATDCLSCHVDDKPVSHYAGQCSQCHSTESWVGAVFDHTGYNNCQSCHSSDAPGNHYNGQCSNCHSIRSWAGAIFNHTGYSNCLSCHSNDAPANHFSGQCSQCHSTSGWQGATFDHSGYTDCLSCHADDAPSGHFSGQCSQCHSTSAWQGASFDHTGYTDCLSCHADDAPSGHYGGQCSLCHNTNGWGGASFNHSGFTDCLSCHADDAPSGHFPGQCSLCHDTNRWGDANFNHDGFTDCISCHADDAPRNHFPGQCSNCHSTNKWGDANFNHDGLTDCISCHLDDRPANHDPGQCSNCHNTQSWDDHSEGAMGERLIHIDPDQPGSLCLKCHLPAGVASEARITGRDNEAARVIDNQ